MSTDQRVFRSFAGLAGGEAIARGLAFVATLLVARRLGPSLYGVIGVASGIMLYLNQIVDAGVELSGVPAVARERGQLGRLVSSALTVRVAIAVLVTLGVATLAALVMPEPDATVLMVYALGLVFVGASTRWVFVGLQQTAWVGSARIAGELTMLILVAWFVTAPADVTMVPVAAVAGVALTTAILLVRLRPLGVPIRVQFELGPSRALFARAPHLVGFTILGLVLFNADLIYLRFVSGQAAAGYYAAAYTFIAFAANLSVTWAHSVLPALARHERGEDERNRLYQTAMLLAFTAGLPVAAGGMLTAVPLIELVFSPEYRPAAMALVWLLPVVPLAAIREIAVVGLIGTPLGERRLIRINAWCALFNVALLIPVVPRWGLLGAAAVTVLTEVVRLILAFRYALAEGYRAPQAIRFVRPMLAAGVMMVVLAALGTRSLGLLLVSGVTVYITVLVGTGVIQIRRPFRVRIVV